MTRFSYALAATLALGLIGCDDPIEIPIPDAGPGMDAAGLDAGPPATACDNAERDGDETGIDCGGSCPACPDGENCNGPDDCESMVCNRGRCLVGTCTDGVRNGDEIGVDCGGDCGLCPGGEPCTSNEQCISGRCRAGMCTMSSCDDGTQNNDETDIDCGGATCPVCTFGFNCRDNADCESLICSMGTCTDPACNDSVQNQDETSVDCGGGICPPCRDGLGCIVDADCMGGRCFDGGCVSCIDMIRNAEETDVDCGGGLCPDCADGLVCVLDGDCVSDSCVAGICESCVDGVVNQDETDVDCGGGICPGCGDGLTCVLDTDCGAAGATCVMGACVSCADGNQNRDETDVDCGGMICPGCAPGLICTGNSDCASMICDAPTMRCNAPGCGDGILNGMETQIDCGGGACLGCPVGGTCVLGRDCLSGVCTGGTCQAPTCTDGVANGGETDVDCGGATTCPRCPDFDVCTAPTDCVTAMCTMGRCGSTGCIPFPGTSTDAFGYFGCTIPMTPATLPCPDISTTGLIGPTTDDGESVVPIGFPFLFYGTTQSMVTIGANGALAFDSTNITFINAPFPRTSTPFQMIAPLWDDLFPPSGGDIRYQTLGAAPNRQFVVRWNIAHISGGLDRIDITVVLNEGGDIEYCYDDADFMSPGLDFGGSATVGISGSAANYLQFSSSMPSLSNGLYMQYLYP